MHVLFLHTNFPAQFGQIAVRLARDYGWRCSFLSTKPVADSREIQHIQFQPQGGARAETHYCVRSFENQTWQSHAAYQALKARPEIQPDLIVAHCGFVSSLFLRELYPDTPHIGYFEFFYHTLGSDMDFRSDLPPPSELDRLRMRARNAQILLDLNHCDAGYSPTDFQRSQMPLEFQPKLRTIFDGIDTEFWKRLPSPSQVYNGVRVPEGHRLVTYVSRGFESIRGFDIFLQVADRICRRRRDVTVLVVGEDRIAYGGDARFTGGRSFKQWTIDRYQPDLERIHFVGRLPPSQLVHLLSRSDLHLYLTVPFVLSWSLMNALSCGCTILASDTPPVREMIRCGENGVLHDFFDIEGWTERSLEMLGGNLRWKELGQTGGVRLRANYDLETAVRRLNAFFGDFVR
ncbi:MAG: glycosyltransferase [Planctomycetaceae bacterium]